jgi:hypothetical protein
MAADEAMEAQIPAVHLDQKDGLTDRASTGGPNPCTTPYEPARIIDKE